MKKGNRLFSLSEAVSLLSQLLLVMGYFLAYAIKGMPTQAFEIVIIVHAAFVMNFIKAMSVLGKEYPKESKSYYLAMTKQILLNFLALLFFVLIWNGLPGVSA